MNSSFNPPPFVPHRWLRSGHLQTVWQLRTPKIVLPSTIVHQVELADGDAIAIHEDAPAAGQETGLAVLLIHGLCGCHASPYMLRFSDELLKIGVRTFRMDMRGCGAAFGLSRHVTHAGRSDDVLASLGAIAGLVPTSHLGVVGVSLGGNQLLRAVGRVSGSLDERPRWWDRLRFAAAISPPIDLRRCSERMQRLRLRPYNRHFIDHLLKRVPPAIQERPEFQSAIRQRRPKTLWQFDDSITAPLSGFGSAMQYYDEASSNRVLGVNAVPTLIIAAADDPIVPIECFRDIASELPSTTTLLMPRQGGHVGFVNRHGGSWMDQVLLAWARGFLV